MNLLAALLIGERDWIWPAVALIALSIILLIWAYRVRTTVTWVRIVAALLRTAAILTLAACLVEPLWSGYRPRPGSNIFVLLADNSSSLQIRDVGSDETRAEQLTELLDEQDTDHRDTWLTRLGQDFDVRRDVVDARIEHVDSFTELTFDGPASSIFTALNSIKQRFDDRPLGGVMLFSDGNATDLPKVDLKTLGLPPIFPVILGSRKSPPDIAIDQIAVSQTSFEDAPITIQADVLTNGFADKGITARLYDDRDEIIEAETLTAGDEEGPLPFRFQFRPIKPGVSFYRVQVRAASEIDSDGAEEPDTDEATLANNHRMVAVDRGTGPHRILYVTGRPNWEFKFLRRAIQMDDQLDLVAMVRVAKKEAKFEFRGREGQSSNPLYRGYKKESDEETERFDEAVIVRLDTKDENELRGGFPKAAIDLFPFKAIILDDVEAEFFTADQMSLLQRFVSERGGGLLMLGGQESFVKGEYRRTAIGDMLPVYLDRVPSQSQGRNDGFRLDLTRDGWLQPWARLRDNETDERQRLESMPKFKTLNRVGSIKPGASVLATVSNGQDSTYPALVVQRYGKGRTAAMTVGDLWRWQLKREDPQNKDLEKSWRQMLRWLVADVPERVEVRTKPRADVSDTALELQIRVRDAEFEPIENAAVQVTIKPPDGNSEKILLDAEPSLKEPGLFETVFVPRDAGAYTAVAAVTDGEGENVGSHTIGWTTDPAADEFQSVAANFELMERIADETGGELLERDELDSFVSGLSSRPMPITERWTAPLWDQVWVYLFAITCLIGEWGLRRWKGMP